ncbi:MAG TPA: hypothetical protein VF989_06705 [Polyangiaceae bacterium]
MDQKTTLNPKWIPELLRTLATNIENDPDYPLSVEERVITVAEFIADPDGVHEWLGYLVNELNLNRIQYPNLGSPSAEPAPKSAHRTAKRRAKAKAA